MCDIRLGRGIRGTDPSLSRGNNSSKEDPEPTVSSIAAIVIAATEKLGSYDSLCSLLAFGRKPDENADFPKSSHNDTESGLGAIST